MSIRQNPFILLIALPFLAARWRSENELGHWFAITVGLLIVVAVARQLHMKRHEPVRYHAFWDAVDKTAATRALLKPARYWVGIAVGVAVTILL
jgi:hypothetical protein